MTITLERRDRCIKIMEDTKKLCLALYSQGICSRTSLHNAQADCDFVIETIKEVSKTEKSNA